MIIDPFEILGKTRAFSFIAKLAAKAHKNRVRSSPMVIRGMESHLKLLKMELSGSKEFF